MVLEGRQLSWRSARRPVSGQCVSCGVARPLELLAGLLSVQVLETADQGTYSFLLPQDQSGQCKNYYCKAS